MMVTGIPVLTDKGREAARNLQVNVTPRCRIILVQVDGRRSLDDIRITLRGLDGLEAAINRLLQEKYVTVAMNSRDLVEDVIIRQLGDVKAAAILRRIEDLHARYGDSCWDHLDDLEKAARHYYGEVVASALKTKIIDILGANRT